MNVGDKVVIIDDAIKHLIGEHGVLGKFGPDGTTAWVELPPLQLDETHEIPDWGVWCSVSNLEVIT